MRLIAIVTAVALASCAHPTRETRVASGNAAFITGLGLAAAQASALALAEAYRPEGATLPVVPFVVGFSVSALFVVSGLAYAHAHDAPEREPEKPRYTPKRVADPRRQDRIPPPVPKTKTATRAPPRKVFTPGS